MNMRYTFLITSFLLFSIGSYSQYNSPRSKIWAFGVNNGLTFNNNPPTSLATSMYQPNEGCASICDTSGLNLLFYSNGDNVWSGDGTLMPHGTNIVSEMASTQSTTQGTLIVPDPGNINRYYLFSLPYTFSGNQLYCNVVDMTFNNGNGDIDTAYNLWHIPITSEITEKMTAARGCGNSIWVIVRTHNGNYLSYHISEDGIDTQAVTSNVGTFPASYYEQGVIKISPKGDKLLACNFQSFLPSIGAEIYDFDKSSGIISNAIQLDDTNAFYGGTFSPDGTKVYVEATSDPAGSIYQFDLNSEIPSSTKTYIGESGQYTDMKIGFNGKIYFAAMPGSPGYNYFNYMGCINNPNQTGAACGYQDSVTALHFPGFDPSMGSLSQGLPNDIIDLNFSVGSFDTQTVIVVDSTICKWPENNIVLSTNDANGSGFIWDDNSTACIRTVTERGTYWVAYQAACGVKVDTFKFNGTELPEWNIIVQNGNQLSTTATFDTYQWYKDNVAISGGNTNTYMVDGNGIYSVRVTLNSGCSDSASVSIINNTAVYDIHKLQSQIAIYPNPARNTFIIKSPTVVFADITSVDGRILIHKINSNTDINIGHLLSGFYLVKIYDIKGRWIKTDKLIKE